MNRATIIGFSLAILLMMGCNVRSQERSIQKDEYYASAERIGSFRQGMTAFSSDSNYLDFDAEAGYSAFNTKTVRGLSIRTGDKITVADRTRYFKGHRIYQNHVYMTEKVGGSWIKGGMIQYNLSSKRFNTILKDCFCYSFEKSDYGLLIYILAESSVHKDKAVSTGLYLYDPSMESMKLLISDRILRVFTHQSSVWAQIATESNSLTVSKVDLNTGACEWTISQARDEESVIDWIPCGETAIWVLDVRQGSISKKSISGTTETVFLAEDSPIHRVEEIAGTETELYIKTFCNRDNAQDIARVNVFRLDIETGELALCLENVVYGRFFCNNDDLFLVRKQSVRGDMYW